MDPCGSGSPIGPPEREHVAVGILGIAAFLVLAVALCARALLDEDRTIPAKDLLTQPQIRLSASLMVRYVCHVMAAGGVGLGALWIAFSRRQWRWSGLEAGAIVLICGAMLSVPVASDIRLALNTAIDMILPLFAAAVLYQLLGHRSTWRRALLAAVVAVAAANCWKATAQYSWEYRRGWDAYQRDKATFWSQRGVRPDDPEVDAWEEAHLMARPRGFIQGINALSSLLLLGLAATGAALAGSGRRARDSQPIEPASTQGPAIATSAARRAVSNADAKRSTDASGTGGASALRAFKPATIIVPAALAALAAWQLVLLFWIQKTVGAMVGLAAALAAGAVGLWLRARPRRLGILLATGLVLLQTVLVVLTVSPPGLRRALVQYGGPAGKIRSLGGRLYIWEGSIRLFWAHPFTGVGPSQFRKHYPAVRSAYSGIAPVGSHNWLLNMAAEWGGLGVLGVVIALGGAGVTVVRAVARPPHAADRSAGAALLSALLIVLACWVMLGSDLPPSWWADVLPYPMAVSLVAAALASLCGSSGTTAQVVLLAGLFGFLVHCTVDETSNVVGVMWPFWALVALTMAWKGHGPLRSTVRTPARRLAWRAGPILAGAAAVAVVMLTVRPMRAAGLIHQAQRAAAEHRPEQAVGFLRAAAEADPRDPLPLAAAGSLCYRLAQTDTAKALEHLRDSIALTHAAVQRNPFDYESWQSLGMTTMSLACAIEEFALVDEAIRDMRRALDLNPQWPAGWLELARMAAVTGGLGGDRPALLRTALDATDKALALEDSRPGEVAPTLSANDRAELIQLRDQLLRRLEAVGIHPAATAPGS